jgi:hypothetical protein
MFWRSESELESIREGSFRGELPELAFPRVRGQDSWRILL